MTTTRMMCRCRGILVITFCIFLIVSCSPPSSENSTESDDHMTDVSVRTDSIAIADYNYDRLIRYNDSVAAKQYADSKRRVQPLKPENYSRSPEKKIFYFYDDFEVYPCQLESADTIIHGIMLSDIASSIVVLGKKWNLIENNVDMPHQNYSNAHGTQFLTSFFITAEANFNTPNSR